MSHPLAALILAGKLGHKPSEEGDDNEESLQENKLDAVRHLIAAIHSKKEEDALQCIENLIELCKNENEEPAEEDKEEEQPEEY